VESVTIQSLCQCTDVLFLLLGAVMIFAMHAGFAFLEVGSVRHQSQGRKLFEALFHCSCAAKQPPSDTQAEQ